jgi:sugar lactone lactonase YvrE
MMQKQSLRVLAPSLGSFAAAWRAFLFALLAASAGFAAAAAPARAQSVTEFDFPSSASFSTRVTSPLGVLGLAGDGLGNIYFPERGVLVGTSCRVMRLSPKSKAPVVVGLIPAPCAPNGLALNDTGEVFVVDGITGKVYALVPDQASPPLAVEFGTGGAGALNLAFDRDRNLWVTEGVAPTSQGRIWKIPSQGGAGIEHFRIPALRNTHPLGVGRQNTRFPQGTTAGMGVAVGIAFDEHGDLFVSDNARGAIWRIEFNDDGSLKSRMGCDSTYPPKTLCLDTLYIQHPLITGAGGIAFDKKENLWVSVIDRNAIAMVTSDGNVQEVFRNPVSPSGLRNEGPLEFPSNPLLLDLRFCVSNFDSDIQDNSPNSGGELNASLGPLRGKISCMDQNLKVPGLPLPIQ